MSNRRQFLGTLGKALGAGTFFLPWSGKGALALPADLGAAAKLPVKSAPLPFSAETVEMRRIKRALYTIRVANQPGTGGPGCPWYETMVHKYRPIERRLTNRPVRTWADCVELAEAIWTFWEKECRDGYCIGPETMRLSSGREPGTVSGYAERSKVVALVEGLLALGGGERFDPRMAADDDLELTPRQA
jgi:hypothetical protein